MIYLATYFAALAAVLGICCAWLAITREFQQARADNLERWLRHHLRAIRTECGHISPQGASIVRSLECALPILGPIDIRALRKDLARIEAERDAVVTEQTRRSCALVEAVAVELRRGAGLPGIGGGL